DQATAATILQSHGMAGTFYVNSGTIADPTHLSWDELATMVADGNEVASHTIDHANLKHLKPDAARQEVCGDRDNLQAHGFLPTSFAYPFGAFDAGTEAIVGECG